MRLVPKFNCMLSHPIRLWFAAFGMNLISHSSDLFVSI